jgi:hypothetical protein
MNISFATSTTMRAAVLNGIREVAAEEDVLLAPLTDDQKLLETGLDSMGFAIFATRMAHETGRDPLATVSASRFPWTIGELIALYEECSVVCRPISDGRERRPLAEAEPFGLGW